MHAATNTKTSNYDIVSLTSKASGGSNGRESKASSYYLPKSGTTTTAGSEDRGLDKKGAKESGQQGFDSSRGGGDGLSSENRDGKINHIGSYIIYCMSKKTGTF